MFAKLEKAYLIGQVAFSILVIIFGAAYCLRCLFEGQFFCAVMFFLIAYVSGYLFLLRASVQELREYLNNQKATQSCKK